LFSTIAFNAVGAKNPTDGSKSSEFDRSEFKREDFATHDFDKNDYRQIEERGDKMGISKEVKDDVSHRANRDQDKDQKKVSEPVHELAGDWVPDKIDATNNGGFGVAPDNGAPLPYNLNGHIDLQRERP
jgi:hypothetical protein